MNRIVGKQRWKEIWTATATPTIKGTVYVLYFISFSYYSKMEMGRNIFMVLFYQTGKKFTAIKAVSGRVKLKFLSPVVVSFLS